MSLYLLRQPMPCLTKIKFFIENSPFLEELKLSFSKMIPQEELEEILRPFTHLRYFSIYDDSLLVEGLPKLSSKLRFLNLFDRSRHRAPLNNSVSLIFSSTNTICTRSNSHN